MKRQRKWDEDAWRKSTGHSSGCNCVRRWRGRLLVTRRNCSCGGFGMTFQKATAQAIAEIGLIEEHTRNAIIKRRDELIANS
mgnify:CR=1 FL=1